MKSDLPVRHAAKKTSATIPQQEQKATAQLVDKRARTVQLQALQVVQNNSPKIQQLKRVQEQSQMVVQRNKYGAINPEPKGKDLFKLLVNRHIEQHRHPVLKFQKAVHTAIKGLSGQLSFMEEASRRRDEGKVKTFTDKELSRHLVGVDRESGLLTHKTEDGGTAPLSTDAHYSHEKQGFAAYVMGENGGLSIFNHQDGEDGVKHSSFSKGLPVIGAGELRIVDGKLTHITSHSGHYKPRVADIANVLRSLQSQGINVDETKVLMHDHVFHESGLAEEKSTEPDEIPGTSKYFSPETLAGLEGLARTDADFDVKDAIRAAERGGKPELSAEQQKAIHEKAFPRYLTTYKGNPKIHTMFNRQVAASDVLGVGVTKPSKERLRMQGIELDKPKAKESDKKPRSLEDLKAEFEAMSKPPEVQSDKSDKSASADDDDFAALLGLPSVSTKPLGGGKEAADKTEETAMTLEERLAALRGGGEGGGGDQQKEKEAKKDTKKMTLEERFAALTGGGGGSKS